MSKKCSATCSILFCLVLLSCGDRQTTSSAGSTDFAEEAEDSLSLLEEEEEELGIDLDEESATAIDGDFDDFLFAYLHSHTLRQERTVRPLRLERADHPAEMLEEFDPDFEFGFMSGDYFTTLFGSTRQMLAEEDDELLEDSIVSLQRINLNDGTIRTFQFVRSDDRWNLETIREATFVEDGLNDFLTFYARFCSDSIFQSESIADPLRIVTPNPDEDGESIDGIIDADQWQTFCPEVPGGIISNIIKEQTYGGHQVVMRKSGLSNGLREVFTFNKERAGWRLTRYEN